MLEETIKIAKKFNIDIRLIKEGRDYRKQNG